MSGNGGGTRNGTTRENRERGVSPLVGIVLLFGMVAVGTVLLFVVGSAMLDTFQSENERERAHLCMDEADHRIETVAATGERQSMPAGEESCRLGMANDGRIDIVWYNGSEAGDLPWDDDDRTVSATLGALEIELDDRTIAHQGGGIWEYTNDQTIVSSDPGISYDGESVRFDLIHLDEDGLTRADPVARSDPEKTDELLAEIAAAASNSNGEHVAFRVESSYHDGWNRYLERALRADDDPNVTVSHDPANETVEVTVESVREVDDEGIIVAEDYGLQGPAVSDGRLVHPDYVSPSPPLEVTAEFENVGRETEEEDVRFEIVGKSIDDGSRIDLDPGETENVTFSVPPGQYRHELTPGERYEYDILIGTESALDEYGSFYVGKNDTAFEVATLETFNGSRTTTISATVENRGVDDGEYPVALEFDAFDFQTEQTLSLDAGAEGTAEWTINTTALPVGTHEFTVSVDGDSETGTIEGGGSGDAGLLIVDDRGILDDDSDAHLVETTDDEFTIGVDVVNTDSGTVHQDVTLSIPGQGIELQRSIRLDSGEGETVEFVLDTDDFETGTVSEYHVSTGDDELDTPGSFYVGEPGAHFELANASATTDPENQTVTVSTDVQNIGVDGDRPELTLDLEYLDGETPEEYGPNTTTIDQQFEYGQYGSVDWQLNQSRLLDGEYRATLSTGDDTETTSFTVTVGVDPGKTGLGVTESASANVTVLGTQVSYEGDDEHHLIPVNLSVVTERDGERTVQHEFGTDHGDNLNRYETWQRKGGDEWTTSIDIEEKSTLTLAATSSHYRVCTHRSVFGYCSNWEYPVDDHSVVADGYTHYYNDDVDPEHRWIDIDATTGASLQNVRVRDHERNTVPELRPAHHLQLSADEILDREGLWDEETETLDLAQNEYVFLFEVTSETDEDGIDALWDEAQSSGYGDPNFNDLLVHVEVERANVDVSDPYAITLSPDPNESPDVGSGDEDGADTDGDVDVTDSNVDGGDSPTVGPGRSNYEDGTDTDVETGLEVESDHIVVG